MVQTAKGYNAGRLRGRRLQHQRIHRIWRRSISAVLRHLLTCSLHLPQAAVAVATTDRNFGGIYGFDTEKPELLIIINEQMKNIKAFFVKM